MRFIGLADEDFAIPANYSERFTYVEIATFAGRDTALKKKLIRALYEIVPARCEMPAPDLEIMIFETPRHNCGVAGLPADDVPFAHLPDPPVT